MTVNVLFWVLSWHKNLNLACFLFGRTPNLRNRVVVFCHDHRKQNLHVFPIFQQLVWLRKTTLWPLPEDKYTLSLKQLTRTPPVTVTTSGLHPRFETTPEGRLFWFVRFNPSVEGQGYLKPCRRQNRKMSCDPCATELVRIQLFLKSASLQQGGSVTPAKKLISPCDRLGRGFWPVWPKSHSFPRVRVCINDELVKAFFHLWAEEWIFLLGFSEFYWSTESPKQKIIMENARCFPAPSSTQPSGCFQRDCQVSLGNWGLPSSWLVCFYQEHWWFFLCSFKCLIPNLIVYS